MQNEALLSFIFHPHPQFVGLSAWPPALASLLAGKHLSSLAASVALDEAAPLELAVALPDARVLVGVVASAAAHEVAAIRVGGSVVAEAAPCAGAARGGVLLAVVRRALQVHQIGDWGLLVAAALLEAKEGGLA